MKLSAKVKALTPSTTLAISNKAKQLKNSGIDVVDFGVGEPDFDTPVNIQEAAIEAIRGGMTRYTAAAGTENLRKAIVDKLKKDNGLDYLPEQIVVSNGAKHSLTNIFTAILDSEDEVIVPAPYWVSYPEMIKLAGGVPVIVETQSKNQYKIMPEEIEGVLTSRTKAIILNSPNNPTGGVYSLQELEALTSYLEDKDIYIISDEIYEKLIYGDRKHISIATLSPAIKDKTIIVNGVSKSYAMTGWRIGYTASTIEVAKAMSMIQSHQTSNPNSIAQEATIMALNGAQNTVIEMKRHFEDRMHFMVNALEEIPQINFVKPDGAFYVLVDISNFVGKHFENTLISNSADFCSVFLEQYGVAVVPGDAFGATGHIRFSYANSLKNIEKGLNRLKLFVTQLQ